MFCWFFFHRFFFCLFVLIFIQNCSASFALKKFIYHRDISGLFNGVFFKYNNFVKICETTFAQESSKQELSENQQNYKCRKKIVKTSFRWIPLKELEEKLWNKDINSIILAAQTIDEEWKNKGNSFLSDFKWSKLNDA